MKCESVAMAGFYNLRIKSASSFFFFSLGMEILGPFFLTFHHSYTYPCLVSPDLLHVYLISKSLHYVTILSFMAKLKLLELLLFLIVSSRKIKKKKMPNKLEAVLRIAFKVVELATSDFYQLLCSQMQPL